MEAGRFSPGIRELEAASFLAFRKDGLSFGMFACIIFASEARPPHRSIV